MREALKEIQSFFKFSKETLMDFQFLESVFEYQNLGNLNFQVLKLKFRKKKKKKNPL